jgi:hypothetical protein
LLIIDYFYVERFDPTHYLVAHKLQTLNEKDETMNRIAMNLTLALLGLTISGHAQDINTSKPRAQTRPQAAIDIKLLQKQGMILKERNNLSSLKGKIQGGVDSGGGDTQCEARIKEIQNDIGRWLKLSNGGPRDLDLHGLNYADYIEGMTYFVYTEPECTSNLVHVEGTEKTCKFEATSPISGRPRITCNTDRFNKTQDYKQYQLIHHEIAGLAGLELPSGSNSRYDVVSDQISDFLEEVTVKKLAVKKKKKVSSKLNSSGRLDQALDAIVFESCSSAGFQSYNEFANSSDYKLLSSCFENVFYKIRQLRIDPPGPTADDKFEQREQIVWKLSEIDSNFSRLKLLNELIEAHESAAD